MKQRIAGRNSNPSGYKKTKPDDPRIYLHSNSNWSFIFLDSTIDKEEKKDMAEQASEMAGWALPKHGSFCWTEIASNDADKCTAFYNAVFGWQFKGGDASPGMDYREFTTGGENPVGGLYQINPAWFGDNPPPPHFMTYVAVDDVDENAKLAVELRRPLSAGRWTFQMSAACALFRTRQVR